MLQKICEVIERKLSEGIVEQAVETALDDAVKKVVGGMFGSYGAATNIIKEELQKTMLPILQTHDYDDYSTKVVVLLDEILHACTSDTAKIVGAAKSFLADSDEIDKMIEEYRISHPEERTKSRYGTQTKLISLSQIFEVYKKFVAVCVETAELEIDFDEMEYCAVEVRAEAHRDYFDTKYEKITFECPHDNDLNFAVYIIFASGHDGHYIWREPEQTISSIARMRTFEMFLAKLAQFGVYIDIDHVQLEDEVTPNDKPEPSYN